MNPFEQSLRPGTGKKVAIIGAPLGYGAQHAGSELGVNAMRIAPVRGKRLVEHIEHLGYEVFDRGDVDIVLPDPHATQLTHPKYLREVAASNAAIAESVASALADEQIPVILGGDHSIAIGSVAGVSSHFREKGEDIGLIWFDAHADCNSPETSITGNIHGMPLAAILGTGPSQLIELAGAKPMVDKRYCAHIGARDLDEGEKMFVHNNDMRGQFFTMSDIDRRGIIACMKDAIAIASQAPGGFAVTFDVDMIDPRFAPGSGTLVRGGTTYREAHLALEAVAESGAMRSFEIVEVNPMLDQSNITVELAVELILSALGKTIL